ncbi:MAG: hypothetical protein Q4E35_04165 [Eubacteriales bacterium]|nr:hypothetical protein [Eubacteriales bacterium]
MYELPPILSGSSSRQLAALRSYLVRMAQQLNSAESAPVGTLTTAAKTALPVGNTGSGEDVAKVRENAKQLKALIVKTSDNIRTEIVRSTEQQRQYTDDCTRQISEECLARSEFGSFAQKLEAQISTTAAGVLESYNYEELIESARNDIGLVQQYMTSLNGQIRRGIVTDPTTDEDVTGIAISQNLQFTGQITQGSDGTEYYRLSSGQTFGLYTSTGWQFWIDGYKRGWYDSVDGMLHIANTAIEDTLQIGGAWRILNENGLGIKFTGG